MNRPEPRHNDALADTVYPWSLRASHLVAMRLAAARAHAAAGRLDAAQGCLIELRVGLVGGHPDDDEGLLRIARAADYRQNFGPERPCLDRGTAPTAHGATAAQLMPNAGRNDWLQASQLSGQAIAELRNAVAFDMGTSPHGCSTALAAWETRHRDRIGRWVRTELATGDRIDRRSFDRT